MIRYCQYFLVGLTLFISDSCKKEDVIPNVYVHEEIYLSDPANVNLNAVGGWIYSSGGVRGIIVYRKSNDEFLAYERNCTYKPSNDCAKVSVDASNIVAVDTCCDSKFQLLDGSVSDGPASYSLKQYTASYDPALSKLTIHND